MTSSAHSKGIRFASLIAAVCVGVVAFSACTKKEITGDDWKNVPPTVRFVNIPPDSSSFSANPIIYWNGTDVDGRVVSYRYVVITKAEITASGLTPEQYIVNKVAVPDSRWTVLPVSLENPQASARVPLQADLSDPVRKVVQQYVFLQAKDDEGAYSQIVYRFYGRNAHFPETALTPFGLRPYINVQRQIRQEGFVFGGVTATWIGTDSLDFQGEQPAMQYEWRLYGPYNAAESLRVVSNFIGFVFRTTDHIYEIGDTLFDTTFDYSQFDIDSSVSPPETTVHVLDADTIRIDTANKLILGSFGTFDTTLRIDSILAPGPNTLNRLVESSYNPLTGQPWTDSVQGLFLDVFRNDPALAIPGADTTRIGTFIFWVRTRDDASVADPTPAFALFNVVEPRHERDLMVIDMSQAVRGRNVNAQSLGGEDIGCANYLPQFDTNKRVISEYVESWRSGSVGPNNQFLFDTGTFQPCGEDSMILPIGQRSPPNCSRPIYQPSRTAPDYVFARALPSGSPYFPTSRDMLKHKVVIFIKDNIIAPLVRGGSEEQELITNGVATGVNIWSMSRASFQETPFNTLQPYFGETSPQGLPGEYAFIFGIRGYFWQAWYGMAIERVRYGLDSGPPLRNEDFVGTYPLPDFVDTTLYPRLSLDTDLLRRRLRWE